MMEAQRHDDWLVLIHDQQSKLAAEAVQEVARLRDCVRQLEAEKAAMPADLLVGSGAHHYARGPSRRTEERPTKSGGSVMMNIVKQMIRGCGALPGIGAHPGTFWLLAFVMIGALAGSEGGWVGALAGAIIMLIGVGPLYLIGAYERAVDSDRAQQRQGAATANDGESK